MTSMASAICGWFFMEHANLSEERHEMVRSHVEADEIYDLAVLKAALLRLFPRVHLRETWGTARG